MILLANRLPALSDRLPDAKDKVTRANTGLPALATRLRRIARPCYRFL
jgi:hypothetical protein